MFVIPRIGSSHAHLFILKSGKKLSLFLGIAQINYHFEHFKKKLHYDLALKQKVMSSKWHGPWTVGVTVMEEEHVYQCRTKHQILRRKFQRQ